MDGVILYTYDSNLNLDGVPKVEELNENTVNKVIVMDIDTVGFSMLPDLKEDNILIALTGRNIPGYIMKLVSLGFYDVLSKPVDLEELKSVLDRALKDLKREEKIIFIPSELEVELKGELCEELCSIVGGYRSMKDILKLTGRAASVDSPVLITGESGTGKELFAKAIWKLSSRWQGPFVAVNCSAIPENLLEAELFGYERGAFTGATSSKAGLIEEANHGILFLDEIGDMPISIQPKILRVLQERKVRRLGSNQEIYVNFRLICATNRDLKKLMNEGKFRGDLYYRITTIHIHLPPLRERKEDIPDLVNCIIRKASKEMGKTIKGYTEEFLKRIMNYPWPGNVRELENILRKAIALNSSGILRGEDLRLNYEEEETVGDFETYIRREVRRLLKEEPGNVYHRLIETVSRIAVEEALKETSNNQLLASKLLGINRLTLRKKLYSNNKSKPANTYQEGIIEKIT